MKVLLDECVPEPLIALLDRDHECFTARQKGWGALTTGALLDLAEGEFDVFLTSDQNIRFQQNLAGRQIAVLILSTNNMRRLEAAISRVK